MGPSSRKKQLGAAVFRTPDMAQKLVWGQRWDLVL